MSAATAVRRPVGTGVKARPAVKAPEQVEEKVQPVFDEPEELTAALKRCNDECAELIRKALSFHNSSVTDTIEKKWHLGEIVEQLKDKDLTRPKSGTKPVNPTKVLAGAIGCSGSYLNKSAQLYRAYPGSDKLAWLTSRRTQKGKPLTYGHMEQLLRLRSDTDSNAKYDEVLKEALANDWSPEEIDQKIKTDKQKEGRSVGKGGRPTPVPGTVFQQLARLLEQTDIIVKNDGELYSNPEHNFMARIKSMPQSAVATGAKDLRTYLSRAQANMTKLLQVFVGLNQSFTEIEAYVTDCELAMAHEGGKKAASAIDAMAK